MHTKKDENYIGDSLYLTIGSIDFINVYEQSDFHLDSQMAETWVAVIVPRQLSSAGIASQ